MRFRELRESDHSAVIAVVDGWWGGRHVADKLPRLFFRLFRETSFAVEDDGELVAFLVGIVGSPAGEARRRGCGSVRAITSPVNRGSIAFHGRMGFEVVEGDLETDGVSVHSDYDGDGKEKVVFRRDLR